MSDPHPTYPKPTITEATCEIAFVSDTTERLSSRVLYNLFGDEFPEMQPLVGALSLKVVVQQGLVPVPANTPNVPVSTGFRLGTASNDRFIQVTPSNFVYQHVGAPYEGWVEFKTKLIELWTAAQSAVRPQRLIKIGLRYVNQIDKDEAHPHLSDWIQSSDDIPAALVRSKGHFLARLEASIEPDNLKMITLGSIDVDASKPHGAILLDIDRVCLENLDVDTNGISEKLEILHDDVWNVFNGAKTALLDSRLKGE